MSYRMERTAYHGRTTAVETAEHWTGAAACPRCGFSWSPRIGPGPDANGRAKRSAREALHREVVNRLAGASFPIRNERELRLALGTGGIFGAGGLRLGTEDLLCLLLPRDYLFTNSGQVAAALVPRAALVHLPDRPRTQREGEGPPLSQTFPECRARYEDGRALAARPVGAQERSHDTAFVEREKARPGASAAEHH